MNTRYEPLEIPGVPMKKPRQVGGLGLLQVLIAGAGFEPATFGLWGHSGLFA